MQANLEPQTYCHHCLCLVFLTPNQFLPCFTITIHKWFWYPWFSEFDSTMSEECFFLIITNKWTFAKSSFYQNQECEIQLLIREQSSSLLCEDEWNQMSHVHCFWGWTSSSIQIKWLSLFIHIQDKVKIPRNIQIIKIILFYFVTTANSQILFSQINIFICVGVKNLVINNWR